MSIRLVVPASEHELLDAAARKMESRGKRWDFAYGGFGLQLAIGRMAGPKSYLDARRVLMRCRDGTEQWGIDGHCDLRIAGMQVDMKATLQGNNLVVKKVDPGVLYVSGQIPASTWPQKDDGPQDLLYDVVGYVIGGEDRFEPCPWIPGTLYCKKLRPVSQLIALMEMGE